jgi:hypothetical protein
MKLVFSQQIFEKYSNIKFRENPFSGSRVAPCARKPVRESKCGLWPDTLLRIVSGVPGPEGDQERQNVKQTLFKHVN